jgi:hypothetical protein
MTRFLQRQGNATGNVPPCAVPVVVLLPRHWSEVVGVDAASVAALVVKVHTFRDRTLDSLVDTTMGFSRSRIASGRIPAARVGINDIAVNPIGRFVPRDVAGVLAPDLLKVAIDKAGLTSALGDLPATTHTQPGRIGRGKCGPSLSVLPEGGTTITATLVALAITGCVKVKQFGRQVLLTFSAGTGTFSACHSDLLSRSGWERGRGVHSAAGLSYFWNFTTSPTKVRV